MRLENTARPAAGTLCLHRDQNPNLRSPTVSGNLQRETLCRSVGRMMCFHCETAPALNYSVKAQPRKPQKPGKRRTASASLAHSKPHLGSAVRSSLLGGVTKTCTISFSGEDINCSWYFLGKQRSTYRGGRRRRRRGWAFSARPLMYSDQRPAAQSIRADHRAAGED